MLLSHSKKAIFIKTRKTAGSSIQMYLCQNGAFHPQAPFQDALIGVPYGMKNIDGTQYPLRGPHSWARHIRDLIGQKTWDAYFSFAVERNPWDKVVSRYWWRHRHMHPLPDFTDWLETPEATTSDRYLYTDDDNETILVDYLFLFEDVHQGMGKVCKKIGLPWPGRLPHLDKTAIRRDQKPYWAYYTRPTAQRVEQAFGWEIRHFGYAFPYAKLGRDN